MAEDYLAQSLEKASADPAHKPKFVQALLASTVLVMGEVEGEDPARRSQGVINAGSKVTLRSYLAPDGKTAVPFFSSLEKLEAFAGGQAGVNYLSIPARMLFALAKGSAVVLNPGSRVSMRISAEDLAVLMSPAPGAPPPSGAGD